jgi:hypothetical protein
MLTNKYKKSRYPAYAPKLAQAISIDEARQFWIGKGLIEELDFVY